MRRLIIVAALTALAAGGTARADEVTGHIEVGNPSTGLGLAGITERVDACSPGGNAEGIDGQWLTVAAGQSVVVTLTGGATDLEDLDVYFYDAECNYIDDESMVTENPSESGTAPAGAAFMIVDLFSGAEANFTAARG